MATGRWQPSATSPATWDSFTWSDPSLVEGSVVGVSTTAGAATGVKGALGQTSGVAASAGSAAGSVGFSGSATGASASSGSATGTEQDVGLVSGSTITNGVALGVVAFIGLASGAGATQGTANGQPALIGDVSGQTTSSGSATGSKPAPAPTARTGRIIQIPQPKRLQRAGTVAGEIRSAGLAIGQQGFVAAARRGYTRTNGEIATAIYTFTGQTRGQQLLIERRVSGIVRIHRIVRQREEDALLAALR